MILSGEKAPAKSPTDTPPPCAPPPIRGGRGRLGAVVLFSVVLGLAMVEVGLRAMTGMGRMPSFRSNALPIYAVTTDGRPFGLRPGYRYAARFSCSWTVECIMNVEMNDWGLRERQSGAELLAHDFKIMAMGDSFTFGYGVDVGQRYSDLLNTILQGKSIAFSVGYADGYSPVDYEAYLRIFYDAIQPDLVIVGLFPENDMVHDVRARVLTRNERGEIVASKLNGMEIVDGFIAKTNGSSSGWKMVEMKTKNYLWDTFAFYRLMEEGRNQVRFRLHPEKKAEHLPRVLFGEHSPSEQAEVETTLAAIKSMDHFLKTRGKRMVVLHIPSAFQVSSRYDRIYTRPGFWIEPEQAEHARAVLEPQTTLAKWFLENDILYVDPTLALRNRDRDGFRMYFDSDGHWTSLGHQVAFEALSRFLHQAGLIPQRYRGGPAAGDRTTSVGMGGVRR